jgi:molybdate transport repressor ModE-like protein
MPHISPFRPALGWQLGNAPVDPRLLPLLAAVRASGSLAAAARACGISYRAAWDLVARFGAHGITLVNLHRGRGAELTAAGAALVDADARGRALLDRLPAVFTAPDPAAEARRDRGAPPLRIVASHDLLLERLLATADGVVETTFAGSLEALAAFARRDADVAGFHIALDRSIGESARPFLHYLDRRRHVVVRLADRDQGLIVPRGNPGNVRTLSAVARRRLRFVNRQRGSGTRMLVDALLGAAGIRPSAIEGYGSQAHSHRAVAEAVAAGRADVGFGVAAAAAELRLDFVPVTRERYHLAVRRTDLARGRLTRLLALLERRRMLIAVRTLPGYDVSTSSRVETLGAAFEARENAGRD